MEERFRQTAAMMEGSTRFFSSTTVVLHNVTHKVNKTDHPAKSFSCFSGRILARGPD